jgi:hypothetical protein
MLYFGRCLFIFWEAYYDIKGDGSLGVTIFVVSGLIEIILGTLFGLAFSFIITGVILAIVFRIKRKKAKTGKKIYTILPIVFLSIGIVVLIVPLTVTFFIRAANSHSDSGYINTGVNVYYDYDKVYGNNYRGSFTLNNIQYESPDLHPLDNIKKLNPVANVENRESPFESFQSFVFNSYNIQTLYVVQNNSGYDILSTNLGDLYCEKTDSDKIADFYNNMSNYNWRICNGIYNSSAKFHNIVLDTDMLNKLEDFSNKELDNKSNNISSDFSEKTILGASKDSLDSKSFELAKYKNKIYYVTWDNFDKNDKVTNVTAIPLDDELSTYFLTIF